MDANTTVSMEEFDRETDWHELRSIFSYEPVKKPGEQVSAKWVEFKIHEFVRSEDLEVFCRRFKMTREFLRESLNDKEVEEALPGQFWFDWIDRMFPVVDMRTRLKEGLDKLSSLFEVPISASLNLRYSRFPIIRADVLKAANMIERKFLKEETDFSKVSSSEAWIKEHGAEIDDMMKPLGKAIVKLINDINKDYGTDYVVLKDMAEHLCWVVYSKSDVSPGTLFLGIAE